MSFRKLAGKKGFSLLELITVVVILGVASGLFFTTFYTTWQAIDVYLARSGMMQDIGAIEDVLTEKVMNNKIVAGYNFPNEMVLPDFMFTINPDGTMVMTEIASGTTTILAHNVDYNNSEFIDNGANDYVDLKLTLKEKTAGYDSFLSTKIQIFMRKP